MAKFLTGSICLTDINKEKITTSKNGKKYININVWINEDVDSYGNIASIQQYLGKDVKEKNYIGNLKEFEAKQTKQEPEQMQDIESDDLPF